MPLATVRPGLRRIHTTSALRDNIVKNHESACNVTVKPDIISDSALDEKNHIISLREHPMEVELDGLTPPQLQLQSQLNNLRDRLAKAEGRAVVAEVRVATLETEVKERDAKILEITAETQVAAGSRIADSAAQHTSSDVGAHSPSVFRRSSARLPKHDSKEHLQSEVRRLSCKVAELSARAMNEDRAVRQMETLNSEVQRLTDKLRQSGDARQVAEQRATREAQAAKEALAQCETATRTRAAAELEANRAEALASKLTKQVKDLEQQLREDWLQRTVLQKTIDTYSEEIKSLKNVQDMLDEEKRSTQKLESQLLEEQKVCAALREEFHARVLGNKERLANLEDCADLLRPRLTDEQSVDAFGEVMKRCIAAQSPGEALKIKRQLLFCFHPDKNPALGVATRITQILNSVDIVGATRSSQMGATCQESPARARNRSQTPRGYPSDRRPQSARPRCRC